MTEEHPFHPPSVVRVAVVGDRVAGLEPQDALAPALQHAAAALDVGVAVEWFPTPELERDAAAQLAGFDAIWCAPGSPYRSMTGALEGIRVARESGRPLLGTCAGFQHGVIEIARNVLHIAAAQHAEYEPDADHLFIDELLCSLRGQTLSLSITDGELAQWYGSTAVDERYYCSFGLHPARRPALEAVGLRVAAVDRADGDVRIMRLDGHPFFVLTLFVPQTRSAPGDPHPIIRELVRAAIDGAAMGSTEDVATGPAR